MPKPSLASRLRAPGADAWWIAAGALLVYHLFAQQRVYGVDGAYLYVGVETGQLLHDYHYGYFTLVAAVRWLLAPLGIPPWDLATFCSALGIAVGLFWLHGACRHAGLARAERALLTVLVAVCPGVFFYATVIEVQGLSFAFVGLCSLMAARLAAAPGLGRALAYFASTWVASVVHSTGATLPFPLGLAVLALTWPHGRPALRRIVGWLAVAGVLHVGCVLATPHVLATFVPELDPRSSFRLMQVALPRNTSQPELAVSTAWNEWLVAYAPLSLTFLLGFVKRTTRALAAAALVSVVAYVGLSFVLVGANDERGAYLLNAVWLAALAASAVRPPVLVVLAVLGAAVSIGRVVHHDRGTEAPVRAADMRAATEGRPSAVIVGSVVDLEMCAAHVSATTCLHLGRILEVTPSDVAEKLAVVDRFVHDAWDDGRTVYLPWESEATIRLLALSGPGHSKDEAARLIEHLEASYRLDFVEHGRFRAWRIGAR